MSGRAPTRARRFRILHRSAFNKPPYPSAESYRTRELARLALDVRHCPRSCQIVTDHRPTAQLLPVFVINRKENVK